MILVARIARCEDVRVIVYDPAGYGKRAPGSDGRRRVREFDGSLRGGGCGARDRHSLASNSRRFGPSIFAEIASASGDSGLVAHSSTERTSSPRRITWLADEARRRPALNARCTRPNGQPIIERNKILRRTHELASAGHRGGWLHRASPGDLFEEARLLGSRRGLEEYRIRARPMPTSSRWSTCAAGKTACKPREAWMRCTRWRPTWAEWASSARNHAQILHNNSLINIHTLEAAQQNGVSALSLYFVGVRLSRVQADRRQRHAVEGRRRLSGAAPGRLRLGEAGHGTALHCIIARTTASRLASSAFTTSSVRWAPGMAGARRLRRRCAARSRWRS